MRRRSLIPALALTVAAPAAALAQGQQAQQPTPPPLEVGTVAPEFSLPGATRYGVLKDPVRLSDFKGKTVVLAFFFRARTRG
ncbi:MAG: redoxin domain-containing protein [Gemmatimonadetes bacterium]|nr:redoxin domain-containing protein [Gemmatimonadota bacterium]MBI2402179.1 redoxin domain-containing protein [Gemmatimonadota bacterium]MBI2537045.1 redoxin domain-containing protein [Gemmatimonadota bacterium]MBI2614101.1 redoxin domain-containing protein [Gemmatimonadota bacterium]MBI3082124.1 redoxin domain-containing protein [Gemmatimonadota bacterium]